ncbi:MAG: alpha-E domain-containing protein [Gammaproteobacteria bacterium]|nr:alpha-E domain-containing protein [Gammaproteobacteria bacterium]MCP5201011.1 alpha-E domain-containing protein [Gammaproteobacteria bacterium]
MLSRVAERLYWLGRYLERIENTARLINVYGNVLLDLPRPAKLVWESLVAITGNEAGFAERYTRADERNVVKFYVADPNNSSSIRKSVALARENARTVREIVPSNSWEGINDLHLYLQDHIDRALTRRDRDAFLTRVINACQFIVGGLDSTMSRDAAWQFLSAGRYLERADMTSRIVDVGIANVFPWVSWMHGGNVPEGTQSPYESVLWMSVLRSLSALQMYRRLVPERVRADEVVTFLLQDRQFPRAVAHCLQALRLSLDALPNDRSAVRAGRHALRNVERADVGAILAAGGLHDFIDTLQVDFAELHAAIEATWFLPPA